MKNTSLISEIIVVVLLLGGCTGKGSRAKNPSTGNVYNAVPDTGYTGIKQYYDYTGRFLVKEVTFNNGVRQGLTRTYYQGGQLYQTFWYENNMKEDSAKWYYLQGPVFRSTPYRHDTVHGIQQQYFMDGSLRAKIGFHKGFRTRFFREYDKKGNVVKGYPEIIINTRDYYKTRGIYRIEVELSDKSGDARFYRGEFTGGVLDTSRCIKIKNIDGKGILDLKKGRVTGPDSLGIIVEILTPYKNRYITGKKIPLPYSDLE
jgi:hypothetical protein